MNSIEALIRKTIRRLQLVEGFTGQVKAQQDAILAMLRGGGRSITEEIDSIPGRRIFYTLSDRIDFTLDDDGLRGEPGLFQVSQDGPFIMTHYPVVAWKPNAPDTADNFGQWSPVGSWPLPTQQAGAGQDRIDISYEIVDGGNQRNFQNEAVGPVLSRPDNIVPLPVPTLWSPNSIIQFFPTYENILFSDDPEVDTTGGQLYMGLPGYRIVSM